MKKYILPLALLVSSLAHADSTKNGIFVLSRSTMSGVVQLRTDVNGLISDPGCEATAEQLKTAVLTELSEDPKGIIKRKFPEGLDYSCKSLVFETTTDFQTSTVPTKTRRGSKAQKEISKFLVTMNVTCVPRSLSEKQLYKLAKSCEQHQMQSCFEDSVLQKLDRVQPTETITKDDEVACMFVNIGFSEPSEGIWWE